MCVWGCSTTNTSYMCKWCGTRYCKECGRGAFTGLMKDPLRCRVCNQTRCQGARVDYVPRQNKPEDDKSRSKSASAKSRGGTKSAKSSRSAKSAKSAKSKKSGKKKKKK